MSSEPRLQEMMEINTSGQLEVSKIGLKDSVGNFNPKNLKNPKKIYF
jgi:hypothetical protein